MRKTLLLSFLFLLCLTACGKQESSIYKIGLNPTWQPFNFQQSQGALNTFLSALMIDFAKEENYKTELINLSVNELLFALDHQEIDAMLSILPYRADTRTLYDFSEPIIALGPVLIVSKESGFLDLTDLKGMIVAVSAFDRSILVAQRIPDVIIREYTNPVVILEALKSREVDGVLMSALAAEQWVSSMFKEELSIVTPPLTDEAIRLVVLKNNQNIFLEKFNHYLSTLRDKELYRNLKKNFLLF